MRLRSQEELNSQYQKNILFLQSKHPSLAKSMLKHEFKTYKIVFNTTNPQTKEGFFNLQNIHDNSLYYNQSPEIQARDIVSDIQAKRDFFTTSVLNTEESSMSVRIQEYIRAEEYTNEHPKDTGFKNKPSKVICFGSALGSLIEALSNINDLKSILVVEPDAELFKYSLFFVDYEQISNKKILYLAVNSLDKEINKLFAKFQQDFVSYNYSTKFVFLKRGLRTYIETITTEYLRTNFFELSFDHYLSVHTNAYDNLLKYPTIDFYSTKVDISMPVLLVMSGPSLTKGMEFVKKAQGKFLIIAVGSSLYPLFKNNIKADICFSMDGKKRKIDEFADIDKEYLSNTLFIASEITDPQIAKYINPLICYFKNQRTVGHYALGVLSEWGFKNIYTLGNDVCVSSNNKEYMDGLNFKEKLVNTTSTEDTGYSYGRTMEIKGNFRPTVTSKMKFLSYISTYEQMKSTYLFDKNVYNLSDGAYIDGMTPLKIEDIDIASMKDIDKTNFIDIKLHLPKEENIFSFDVDLNIKTIKELITYIQSIKIDQTFYTLTQYINHRDATFMNNFAKQTRSLHDVGAIMRYVLFFDNLMFSYLDNVNFNIDELNTHIKALHKLYLKGITSVLEVALGGLNQALVLRTKIRKNEIQTSKEIMFNSNINKYLATKYYLFSNSPATININSSLIRHKNTTKLLDKNTIKEQKLEKLPNIVKNILYDMPILEEIPSNIDDIVLIVTYRNNFLQYYKQILSQLEKHSIKRVHFHILNTYYCEEKLDNNIFSSFNIQASITVQEKFVFFTHLFHYLSAITYDFINVLLRQNVKNITLLDMQSLVLKDFSSIKKQEKDFCYYNINSSNKEVLFIRASKISKTIIKTLLKNAKLNIYINASMSEITSDLLLIQAIFKNDISCLPKKYCDDKFSTDSYIWIKPITINSSRFENKQIHSYGLQKKDDILSRKLNTIGEFTSNNKTILGRVASGRSLAKDTKDYNGFYQYSLAYDKKNISFLMLLSQGDDIWVENFFTNQYYNKTTLVIWDMLCSSADGFVVDADSYNGIFSIFSQYYFRDTITIEKDAYRYSKTKINLKTNNLSIDSIYLDNMKELSTFLSSKIHSDYKDIISLFKGSYSKKLFKHISFLNKAQKQSFDILLSITTEINKQDVKKFTEIGYTIYYIDEQNSNLSSTYANNQYIYASKAPSRDILDKLQNKINLGSK